MNNNKKELSYIDSVHKYGYIWGYVIFAIIISFPIALCLIFSVVPSWKAFLTGMIATIPVYWTVGIIEIFTYVPMLGVGGSYLSFITGNISNLKLPCAIGAMEAANVKPSSEEGEVISTISIAVSSIVTMSIIIIGVCLIIPLTPILNAPILKPAFDQIVPALFGGLAVAFVSRNWKISIIPIVLMLVLFIFVPALNSSTVGIMVPVGVIVTLIEARIMYKKGLLDEKPKKIEEQI